MDVWNWVERRADELRDAGETRLAHIIYALPSAVVDEAHQDADAMIEEGLQRARELGDAWLEVYFRHWALQSRVLHRNDARRLGDAIGALAFSHRDECRGCPQTMCTVQDVASCYGLVDGAGYAQERLAVCDEALAKVTPAWSCFVCLSNEKIDALLDNNDLVGAMAFATAQRGLMAASGESDRAQLLNMEEILLRQGKYAEALTWSQEAADEADDSESERMRRQLVAGVLHAHLDQADEARAALPPLAQLQDRPGQLGRWLRLASLMAERGMLENTAMLRLDMARAIAILEGRHIFRMALENAEKLVFLAVAAKRRGPAARALAVISRCLPQLAQPLDAPEKVRMASQLVANLAWHEVEVGTLGTRLQEVTLREDAAVLLEELESAFATESRTGEGHVILVPLAAFYRRLGLADESIAVLRKAFGEAPSEELMYQLGNTWVGEGQTETIEAFIRELGQRDEPWAKAGQHWFSARLAMQAGRYAAARDELLAAMPLIQPGHGVRTLAAECERRLGNLAAALTLLRTVIDGGAEPGPWDWEHMAVATMAKAWPAVRDSAARLGLEAELGDTTDHGAGEFCQITFEGEPYAWDAVRIGPVTARITEIGPLSVPAHFDDVVVFDRLTAKHLGDMPVTADDVAAGARDEPTPVFSFTAMKAVEPGAWFRFAIDGVHPGDEALEALATCLQAFDARAQDVTERIAQGTYELTAPDGEELGGLYLLVALAPDVNLPAVATALANATATWEHPVIWLRLAEAVGDAAQLVAQRDIAARYAITA